VLRKRAEQLLSKQSARLHIVEGFLLAVDDVDNVVKAIRSAEDGREAKQILLAQWEMSEEQADAVLNMSLRRLTGLAIGELRKEHTELTNATTGLNALLADPVRANV
jgi:DNA gyrase subunit A